MTSQPTIPSQDALREAFHSIRSHSLVLCEPLETEDYVVQPIADVSPPKWHLAHTSWFFEELLLVRHVPDYARFNEHFPRLFNSYYKSAGEHWLQAERGQLSRPTVREVLAYREHVDHAMDTLLRDAVLPPDALAQLEIGLHHEQQHQELLLMDIKYILGANPSLPSYRPSTVHAEADEPLRWHPIAAGNYTVGYDEPTFAFDNERPGHTTYLHSAEVRSLLVSNAEYLAFIEDGGYDNPAHWLSMGWEWVQREAIDAPLYWHRHDNQWQEFTLTGLQGLDDYAPVAHISYFEASAFASWAGLRLPTEFELETTFLQRAQERENHIAGVLHPARRSIHAQQLWCWTSSSYAAYPNYQPYEGMLGEYNGKFMCNQYVLRGGCIATPPAHYRPSYRNFYLPVQRWMFSGIALARDTQ